MERLTRRELVLGAGALALGARAGDALAMPARDPGWGIPTAARRAGGAGPRGPRRPRGGGGGGPPSPGGPPPPRARPGGAPRLGRVRDRRRGLQRALRRRDA